MKTRILTFAFAFVLMFACASVFGGKPQSFVPFYNKNGIVNIPVKVEEAPDSLPQAVKLAMLSNQIKTHCNVVCTPIDLSRLTKPEPDAEDVIIDTWRIFNELRYLDFARK